jgi:cytochrome c556
VSKQQLMILGVALVLVLLAIAAWLGFREPAAPGGARLAIVAPGNPAASANPAAAARQGDTPPPWAGASPVAPGIATAPPAGINTKEQQRQLQMRELEKIQTELTQAQREGYPLDPRQVDAALAKIQQVTGSNMIAGVNVDALRTVLQKSQEMKVVAAEMEIEAKKQGGPDIQKIHAYVDQLQKLQSQMTRTEVVPAMQPSPAGKTK